MKVSGKDPTDYMMGYEPITELLSGGTLIRNGADTYMLAEYDPTTGGCDLTLSKDSRHVAN